MNQSTTAKRSRKAVANWPLFTLAGAAAVAVEGVTVALLWSYEPDHVVGLLYSALSVAFTLLGLVVSRAAGLLRSDPRPNVASRAFAARVVSLVLVVPSAVLGGGAMALKMETRAADEYAHSKQFELDQQQATDPRMDSQAQRDAAAATGRAMRPSQVRMDDPAYIGGVLAYLAMLGLPTLAVGCGLTFAPETEAQRKRRIAEAEKALRRAKRKKAKKTPKPAAPGLRLVR